VILRDGLWWRDVGVTFLITVITVTVELVIGFAFATVMHRMAFGRGIVRTSILVPYGIVTVVSAFAWKFAFATDSGFVNSWLGLEDYDFFAHFGSSLLAICMSEIWKTTPFMSLLLLAGLAQIPEEVDEAAKIDGATWWQRLWRVTIPNMKASIMVAMLFRTLDAYRIFDNVFVMTNGAQNTETVSFLAYRQIISRTAVGLGSAVSVLLFLTVVLIAFVFITAFKTDLSQVRGER
jgi:multiple sugar transport system permease protein